MNHPAPSTFGNGPTVTAHDRGIIEDAIHTTLAEIGDAHPNDQLDCVYGIVGAVVYDRNTDYITTRMAALR